MKNQSVTEAALQNYTFKRDKPIFSSGSYNVFVGTQTETNVPVTIKIIKQYHLELPKYLKKIKDCKSDNVIKVFETIADSGTLIFVTERVSYGNLGNALQRCERLDDADSVFISKMILNGHIDLLRTDCNWFGTDQDIEFTDTGIKLSWNHSISYNLVSPIGKILEKISMRPESRAGDMNLLPFPKSKIMLELIRISKENASQISLNPQMKKKEKIAKKKGKNWMALKEYKNRNQYFDESSFLGVSQEHGIVRIKVYEAGKINPMIMALNKTKRTFTKVIQSYDQNGKTIIISQYSNDGHLQAYVTKLKTSGVTLSEEHIQFFFYSLFEPLKQVQESPLKSINMLHIKNIYIQNGIPKIGEPIPLNKNIEEILIDRAEVPDFYHSSFKKNPTKHQETFDTYSLGVLLYKLMYTEYPIFPNGLVHIPTTPNYNKRLKTTLQIFLNQGGRLKQIQSRIEVSENVLKQVKENKQKLIVKKKENNKKDGGSKRAFIDDDDNDEKQSKSNDSNEQSEQTQSDDEDKVGCCTTFCAKLELAPGKEVEVKNQGAIGLEQSPYRIYRICTKIFVSLIVYIFLFYFYFLQNDVMLMANQNLLTEYNVTISNVNYSIITTDANRFQNSFSSGSSVSDLLAQNCLISNYNGNPDYHKEILYEHSSSWVLYIVTALLTLVLMMGIRLWQIYRYDLVRVVYFREKAKFRFNLAHFIIMNLMWANLIYGHYFFFNFIFNGQTEPCVGGQYHYAAPDSLFNNISQFKNVYIVTLALQFILLLIECFMIGFTGKVKYNKLLNPIVIFGPIILITWLVLRIGVINGYFYPNLFTDGEAIRNYFTDFDYINFLGTIPQVLVAIELLVCLLVDIIFWVALDKKRRLLVNETSSANLGQI